MANIDVNKIRNVAVVAHSGAGKTSLVEAMLFDSGSVDRLGAVQDGNTTTDYEPEEIARQEVLTFLDRLLLHIGQETLKGFCLSLDHLCFSFY